MIYITVKCRTGLSADINSSQQAAKGLGYRTLFREINLTEGQWMTREYLASICCVLRALVKASERREVDKYIPESFIIKKTHPKNMLTNVNIVQGLKVRHYRL